MVSVVATTSTIFAARSIMACDGGNDHYKQAHNGGKSDISHRKVVVQVLPPVDLSVNVDDYDRSACKRSLWLQQSIDLE